MKLFIEEHFDLNLLVLQLKLGSTKINSKQSDRETQLISAVLSTTNFLWYLYKSSHWQVLANYNTIVKVPFSK